MVNPFYKNQVLDNPKYGSELKTWTCHDCKKIIVPPLGKPFSNGDGKIRCASCAVDLYMKQPGAGLKYKKNSVWADVKA